MKLTDEQIAELTEHLQAIGTILKIDFGATTEGAETEAAGDEKVELPDDLAAVAALPKEELQPLAAKINLSVEGKKNSEIRAMLATIVSVVSGEGVDDLEEEAVNAVLEGLSLTPKKKQADNIVQITEYFNGGAEEATAEVDPDDADAEEAAPVKKGKAKPATDDDDDGDADDDDAEEAAPAKKGKAKVEAEEEPADEEVDFAAVAAKAKLPKEAIMATRLKAHNEAGGEINVKKLGTEKAYRKLIELMVTNKGEVAEWGTPYVQGGNALCCGLEMGEVKVKKGEGQRAQCAVTEAQFDVSDEGEFTPVE